MISTAEAKAIISKNTNALEPVSLLLFEAAGKMLSEDIFAQMDIPAFPQSSMDGYAFSFDAWKQGKPLIIEGESAAGNNQQLTLPTGKAARIFTGAPVPDGADTVIMQEKVKIKDNQLLIEDAELQKENSVRSAGSEIKKGALALPAGTLLSPAAIGFLASIGIATAKVIPDPTIIIIVTGNELQQPGEPLQYGQVYESNSIMLGTALKQVHMTGSKILHAEDKLPLLTSVLKTALEQADLVLLTGGISAGDYDFVLPAAGACDVRTLFHKIKQRPGKPLFFGKKGNKLVFGLPGNPSSVLTCFYEYVLPALSHLTGRSLGLKTIKAALSKPYKKSAALTVFLKAFYDGERVTVLDAQESYRLSSFATSNCLLVMEENAGECAEGAITEIHLLPE